MTAAIIRRSPRTEPESILAAVKRRIVPLEDETYSRIPKAWKDQDIWLPYRLEAREGKPGQDKKPFDYRDGNKRYKAPGGEWITCNFRDALDAAREHDGDGVGIQCGQGLIAFDFDAAIKDGVLLPWALDALKALPSAYAELSVSKTGIKVIIWCDDPPRGKPSTPSKGEGDEFHRSQHIQLLGSGFNAVTGNTLVSAGDAWSRDQVVAACAALEIKVREKDELGPAQDFAWDENLVRDALQHVDPDCPRAEWISIGMALHSGAGAAAEGIWHEWSKGDLTGSPAKTYDLKAAQVAWDSFGRQQGVTLMALFGAARKGGWLGVSPGSEAWLVDRASVLLRPRLRFLLEDDNWALWTGGRWRRWSSVRARRLIHTTNVESKVEITRIADVQPSAKKAELIANAKSVQTKRVADAVMALLAGDLHGSVWDFDSARTAGRLNFSNGVVDLASGVLGPHDPDLGFSRVVPYAYDADASCPRWQSHIAGMFEDAALTEAFRMFVGYTVVGSNDAKTFGILYGEKDTGKSTTSEAIDRALGRDFAETVKRGVFMRQRSVSDSANSHDANVIPLVGRRKINIHEPDENARWDEELVKQWTGGDGIALRRIYGETATFQPPGVLWALCNTLPKADEFSDAFWSRAVVFPCVKPRPRQEGFLRDMLERELAGIGAWCVRAARDYLALVRDGGSPMQAARERTEKTIVDARFVSNPLGSYIYATYVADPNGAMPLEDMLRSARAYFRANPGETGFEKTEMVDAWISGSITSDRLGRVLKALDYGTQRLGRDTSKVRVAKVRLRQE